MEGKQKTILLRIVAILMITVFVSTDYLVERTAYAMPSNYEDVEVYPKDAPYELTINNGVVTGYTGEPVNAIIPEGVTEIAPNAFYENNTVESITFPKSLKKIGENAFHHCDNLETVVFSEGLTEIEASAFGYCQKIKGITLPSTLLVLGDSSFSECSKLSKINIPDKVTTIRDRAFYYTALEEIIVPDSVSTLGKGVFRGCINLKKIQLPKNLEIINEELCFDCISLHDIKLGDRIKVIAYKAFFHCESLESIQLPNTVESIGEEAFSICNTLSEINFPDSLKEIKNKAFIGCIAMKSIKFPKSLVRLGEESFYSCWGLKDIQFEACSLASIEPYTFHYCSSLETVCLPDGLLKIDNGAFGNTAKLTQIIIPASVTQISSNAFNQSRLGKIKGNPGSYAETFANANGIPFEKIIPTPKLSGIKVIKVPDKTEYTQGESLCLDRLTVEAEYSDGTKVEIKDYEVKGYDATAIGEQKIQVEYKEFSDVFDIRVIAKPTVTPTPTPTPVSTIKPHENEYTQSNYIYRSEEI